MTTRLRRSTGVSLLAVATLAAIWMPAVGAAAPDEKQPTLAVDSSDLTGNGDLPGAVFRVEGANWPADTLVQLEVCGNLARSGSIDCAADTGQVVASDADGSFQGVLAVVVPPSPCPCAVRAFSQTTDDAVIAPVRIPGAPSAGSGGETVTAAPPRRLDVEHARLRGHDSWNTWLGGPARRTLEFDLVNTGTVALQDVTVALTAGPGDHPTGFLPPISIDRLEVGERRTVSVPVEFDDLAFGTQAVLGSVNGTSAPVSFDATTSTHPWLLIILALLAVGQMVRLGVRAARRRHHHATDGPSELVAAVDGPADDSLICVVDVVETTLVPAPPTRPPLRPDSLEPVDTPVVQHHTLVLHSIAAVKQLVRETIAPPEEGAPARSITAITVLADADAKVGDAHRSCDDLCVWIDAVFADAGAPLSFRRRHVSASSPGVLGMVPLSVLVRSASVAA